MKNDGSEIKPKKKKITVNINCHFQRANMAIINISVGSFANEVRGDTDTTDTPLQRKESHTILNIG